MTIALNSVTNVLNLQVKPRNEVCSFTYSVTIINQCFDLQPIVQARYSVPHYGVIQSGYQLKDAHCLKNAPPSPLLKRPT